MTAETLMERVRAHELWLSSVGREGSQLVGEGLALGKLDLSGRDLSEALIPAADFAGAVVLRDCRFISANLAAARFEGATLVNVDLTKANVDGARFDGARVSGGTWFRATCVGASLSDVLFDGTVLERVHPPVTEQVS